MSRYQLDDAIKKTGGVLGVTDEGFPIVTDTHCCPHWAMGSSGVYQMRECWYCRFADFRKTADAVLCQSICRYPSNRASVLSNAGNDILEEAQSI